VFYSSTPSVLFRTTGLLKGDISCLVISHPNFKWCKIIHDRASMYWISATAIPTKRPWWRTKKCGVVIFDIWLIWGRNGFGSAGGMLRTGRARGSPRAAAHVVPPGPCRRQRTPRPNRLPRTGSTQRGPAPDPRAGSGAPAPAPKTPTDRWRVAARTSPGSSS